MSKVSADSRLHRSALLVLTVSVALSTAFWGCGDPPEHETDEVVDALEAELHQLRLEASALSEENARLTEQLLMGRQGVSEWRQLERIGSAKGLSPFARYCPEGMGLVGFDGQAGAVIDGLLPVCSPFTTSGETVPGPIHVELAAAGPSIGGDYFQRRCKAGDHAVAIRGHAGENISSIEVVCGRYREKAKQYPLPVVGGTGGASYYRHCPNGFALAGVSGRVNQFVSSLVPLCAPLPVKSVHTNEELREPRRRLLNKQPGPTMKKAMVPKPVKGVPEKSGDADDESRERSDGADGAAGAARNGATPGAAKENLETKENQQELSPR